MEQTLIIAGKRSIAVILMSNNSFIYCSGCSNINMQIYVPIQPFQKRQKKIHFMLFGMSVVYVLTTPMPEDEGENPTAEQVRKKAKMLKLLKNYEILWKPNIWPRMPQDDDVGWWVDFGATVHVCKDRCWFKTYESLNDVSILYMGNESTTLVHGRGCVDLRLNIVFDNIGSAFMSTSKLNDSIFWHARLDHVHFKRMQDMSKDGDLCDLHATPSLGNKKYFMTFIDDAFRAAVRLPGPKLKTLGERGIECIFFEYAKHSKAFKFYVIEPNDSIAINSIIESYDAIFDEHRFSSVPRPSQRSLKDEINDEMDSIIGNNTWVLTDPPLGCRPLGCKWIFKRKLKVDGTVEKFKASKFDASGKGVIIYLYVDDMMIFGTDQVQVDLTKEFLSSRFSMKEIGETDVILSIRIKHESNGIAISQSHHIKKVLKKFNYSDCTPASTPLDTYEKLMPNKGLAVSHIEYSKVIGCLMYVMACTRLDIAFDVGKLSRYTSNPITQHWQAIQRVLKYLKKTMDYRLVHSGYLLVMEGYTDASWISNTKDNSSISVWVFLLGGGVISWASKNQTCITGSTMEYEFVALTAAGKEAEWLKNLLLEIPLWVKPIAPISIRCDSAATLAKAYSQMYNGKSKHLGVRHSMIRELIMNGVVSIEFVRSQQNLADHLTKGLARDLVIKSAEWMGLKSS
nr:zinc finger, CCHC-type [Tanacetum cinerariifolium]